MLTVLIKLAVVAATVGADASATPAVESGTFVGSFIYDGAPPRPNSIHVPAKLAPAGPGLIDESLLVGPDGGIKNVAIFLRSKDVRALPAALKERPATVEVRSSGLRYTPRVVFVGLDQTLVIKNNDPIDVEAHVTEPGGAGLQQTVKPGKQAEYKFNRAKARLLPIEDAAHGWYRAIAIPCNHPYVAVSDADGHFEIKNLPIGKFEFQVLHERAGAFRSFEKESWKDGRFEFEIKPGKNDLGKIKIPAKLFEK